MRKIRQVRQLCKALFLSLLFLSGCAGKEAVKAVKKDAFFEKWHMAAKESLGHSPAPRGRVTVLSETKTSEGAPATPEKGVAPAGNLPKNLVTMEMRQADVKSVIRALARSAGVNILLKNDIKGEINANFTNVPWEQAFNSILQAQGLSYVQEGDIIRVVSLEDMEQSAKMAAVREKQKVQSIEEKIMEPLATMVVNVDYADPDALRDNLLDFLTKNKDGKIARGSIKVDKHSNSLIIQAIHEDLDRMIPIIEKLDKPTHQINIKANIVETTKDMARNLGIQWGGMYRVQAANQSLYFTPGGSGGSATLPQGPFSGAYNPTSGSGGTTVGISGTGTGGTGGTNNSGVGMGISGQGFGVNFPADGLGTAASSSLGLIFGTIGGNVLEAQLSALQNDNKLNILSSPSITTLDNQMAYTENGEKVPYVTLSTSGIGSGTTQTVSFENAVLRLEITPHVIDEKNLKMKIIVKKDEVDPSRNVLGNPFIIKKQTETTLIVRDGETIVISGLSKKTTIGNSSGVPMLKDLPVLGWLFKNISNDDKLEEVLIFITPKILPPQVAELAPEVKG